MVNDPFTINENLPTLRSLFMIRSPNKANRRSGASLVEFAFVGSIALLFLFGIFEYARFVFNLHVIDNAAREGARYAVVHTGDGTTTAQVLAEVTNRLAGLADSSSFTITVTNVDPTTGVAQPGAWTDTGFGNAIEVKITGTYKPALPSFLGMGASIPLDVRAMMSSEAN
jgi:Flp pilus assembly protein TadG